MSISPWFAVINGPGIVPLNVMALYQRPPGYRSLSGAILNMFSLAISKILLFSFGAKEDSAIGVA